MDYERLINGMKRFGSNETDICVHGLGIAPSQVQDNVVIAPWWEPATLPGLGKAEYLSESDYSAIKIWNVVSDSIKRYISCVQVYVQINNRSRKPPIYQYLCVRGFVRIPSRSLFLSWLFSM